MVVAVLRLELLLHAPQNLKEKRGIVKKILGRIRERYPVSCAETGHHDLWQRAELGFALVARSEADAGATFEKLEEQIASLGVCDTSERFVEMLHY